MKETKVIFAVILASPLEIFHREATVKKNAENSTIRGNIGCLLLTRAIALAKHTARNAGKREGGWVKKREGGGRGKEKYPDVRLMRVYFTWNWKSDLKSGFF